MGAVTVAIKKTVYSSAGKIVIADVTFSGTYAAGGDTYTPGQFGMRNIDAIDCPGAVASASTGFMLAPDLVGQKLRLLGGAASGVALAENGVAGQTGTVARVVAYGDNPYV
jgi:hypothetical protein